MTRTQIREDAEKRNEIALEKVLYISKYFQTFCHKNHIYIYKTPKIPFNLKPKEEVQTHLTTTLEENINRVEVEGVEARTVDEALSVLRYLLYFCSNVLFRNKRFMLDEMS